MTSVTQKIDALVQDLQKNVDKYNEANQILLVCKEEIIALQGALKVLKELEEEENTSACDVSST
jgi:esterase/lipase